MRVINMGEGRRVTPDDRVFELEDWLKTMRGLGVGVDATFETELALLGNARALGGHLGALKAGAGLGRPQVIARLATDAGTFEDTMAMITTLVAGRTPEHQAATEDILRRAFDRAEALAVSTFAAHGDELLKILAPAHKRIVAEILASADQIPDTITTLEQAARKHVGEAWLSLERSCAELDKVRDLVAGWVRDGVLKHKGKRPLKDYSPGELLYGDYPKLVEIRKAAYRSAEPVNMLTARCVATCQPVLRTTAQADKAA